MSSVSLIKELVTSLFIQKHLYLFGSIDDIERQYERIECWCIGNKYVKAAIKKSTMIFFKTLKICISINCICVNNVCMITCVNIIYLHFIRNTMFIF